jgi:hypothetical protein
MVERCCLPWRKALEEQHPQDSTPGAIPELG